MALPDLGTGLLHHFMDIRMMAFKADVFDDIESGLPNFPDLVVGEDP
jgi:hypothetical protein